MKGFLSLEVLLMNHLLSGNYLKRVPWIRKKTTLPVITSRVFENHFQPESIEMMQLRDGVFSIIKTDDFGLGIGMKGLRKTVRVGVVFIPVIRAPISEVQTTWFMRV